VIQFDSRYSQKMLKIQDKDCLELLTDERLVFPDLIREAKEFFDLELSTLALKQEEENNQTISIENTFNTSELADISALNEKSIITTNF
jgi:hypothetical protein